VFFLILFKNI